jgi:hypothetical protein
MLGSLMLAVACMLAWCSLARAATVVSGADDANVPSSSTRRMMRKPRTIWRTST